MHHLNAHCIHQDSAFRKAPNSIRTHCLIFTKGKLRAQDIKISLNFAIFPFRATIIKWSLANPMNKIITTTYQMEDVKKIVFPISEVNF